MSFFSSLQDTPTRLSIIEYDHDLEIVFAATCDHLEITRGVLRIMIHSKAPFPQCRHNYQVRRHWKYPLKSPSWTAIHDQ